MGRVYPAYYEGDEEKLVTPENPLPVTLSGQQGGTILGASTWIDLEANVQNTGASSGVVVLLADYVPPKRYQTLVWVVQVPANSNLRLRIDARLDVNAGYVTVADATVTTTATEGEMFALPVDGFYNQYRFRIGDTSSSNPAFYGKLVAY